MRIIFEKSDFMKIWVCDECGKEISGPRPEKCGCGSDIFIEIEKIDGSGTGCKGPGA
jgi:ABC-type ATPase with predicted acetyltransferase domain